MRLKGAIEIQASLRVRSPLFFRLIEDGDHHCHGDLYVPCDVAFFPLLFFFYSVCRNAAPSLYFEPKPNLSKTLEGLLMRLIIIVNTILWLTSLNITICVCYVSGSKVNRKERSHPFLFVCFVLPCKIN